MICLEDCAREALEISDDSRCGAFKFLHSFSGVDSVLEDNFKNLTVAHSCVGASEGTSSSC